MNFIKSNFQIIALALLIVILIGQCTNSRRIAKVEKQHKNLVQRIDSTYLIELKKAVEVEGLKISKRTLYDWNSVVRTAVRPDDRMHEYDQQIDKLEKASH
jgi:hypothetical protein